MNSITHSPLAAVVLLATLVVSGCSTFSKDPRVRTPGAIVDDEVLERVVKRSIRKGVGGLKGNHVVVVSYNQIVLLTGQVASEQIRTQAEQIAANVHSVRRVHNELQIGGPISYVSRTNDSWITTKVKSRLFASKHARANQVKVVTENGTVYMMGLLPRQEADRAVDVAKGVYGVQKIVKVFEYMDTPQQLAEQPTATSDPLL